jgi:hypothetical protein
MLEYLIKDETQNSVQRGDMFFSQKKRERERKRMGRGKNKDQMTRPPQPVNGND